MKLHTYYRSSASYRVRIALNLKGIAFEAAYIHLSKNGGEQFGAAFSSLNPQNLLPVLEDGANTLTQSLAIIEYLDEVFPATPLMPATPVGRARVRELSLAIACDIHPLNNLRVLKYLSGTLGASVEQKNTWYRHWVNVGLTALEKRLAQDPATGRFCHDDQPSVIDCCLVPQIYNAKRFDCDLSVFPTIMRIVDSCEALEAFQLAYPDRQPDAQ